MSAEIVFVVKALWCTFSEQPNVTPPVLRNNLEYPALISRGVKTSTRKIWCLHVVPCNSSSMKE